MEDHENYKRLLVALEAWPQMNLPAFTVYRRLWDALGGEPGAIDIAVTQDAGKYHLTPQSLRRALAKLEEIGLVKREIAFEDEFQIKQIRYAVHDALEIRGRAKAPPAEVETPQPVQTAAPKVARAPISAPAPESAPISKSVPAPTSARAPESVSAPKVALPPSGGASPDWHGSCATPNALDRAAESETARPQKHPPSDTKNQETKSLSTPTPNSRTKSNQAPRPNAPQRADWPDFDDGPQRIGGAIGETLEKYASPVAIEQERLERMEIFRRRILDAIRYAERVTKAPAEARMPDEVAVRAARVWRNLEENGAEISQSIDELLDCIRGMADGRGFTASPGAYFNFRFGKMVRNAGGRWSKEDR